MNAIKNLSEAVMVYTAEADDKYPEATHWMDLTLPMAKTKDAYRSPYINGADNEFGYAFRRSLSRRKENDVDDLEHTALVFDSTDLRWDSSGGLELLPREGRNRGRNGVLFADGHANWVRVGYPGVK